VEPKSYHTVPAIPLEVAERLITALQEFVGQLCTLAENLCCVNPAEIEQRFAKVKQYRFDFFTRHTLYFLNGGVSSPKVSRTHSNISSSDIADARLAEYSASILSFILVI
jgi:hypothetical protein